MIYELLSTALLACSLGSSTYRNEPKRLISSSNETLGVYTLSLNEPSERLRADTPFGDLEALQAVLDDGYYKLSVEDNQNANIEAFGSISQDRTWGAIGIYWYFATESECNTFRTNLMLPVYDAFETDIMYADGDYAPENTNEGWRVGLGFASDEFREGGCYVSFRIGAETIYNYTETKNHCSPISGTGYTQLPATFTTPNNPYKIGFACNDGYYFKTDGSNIMATGGIEILSVDYGNYPTISHLVYSTRVTITLNLPLADCSLTLNPVTLSVQEVNDLYGDGFDDAKAIYGDNIQFEWIKTAFDGMAGFFNIQILPNISLGFLMFAPLVVVAIVAIVRIIKHE